jgi:hypothetical protein
VNEDEATNTQALKPLIKTKPNYIYQSEHGALKDEFEDLI